MKATRASGSPGAGRHQAPTPGAGLLARARRLEPLTRRTRRTLASCRPPERRPASSARGPPPSAHPARANWAARRPTAADPLDTASTLQGGCSRFPCDPRESRGTFASSSSRRTYRPVSSRRVFSSCGSSRRQLGGRNSRGGGGPMPSVAEGPAASAAGTHPPRTSTTGTHPSRAAGSPFPRPTKPEVGPAQPRPAATQITTCDMDPPRAP